MNDEIKIEISADITMTLGDKIVVFSILPKKSSNIVKHDLLKEECMPEDFSEIIGFERIDESDERATIKEVMLVSHAVVPHLFLMSLDKPLLFICSKLLALYTEKIYKNKYDIKILRGSLSKDDSSEFKDDAQIVMLSSKHFT